MSNVAFCQKQLLFLRKKQHSHTQEHACNYAFLGQACLSVFLQNHTVSIKISEVAAKDWLRKGMDWPEASDRSTDANFDPWGAEGLKKRSEAVKNEKNDTLEMSHDTNNHDIEMIYIYIYDHGNDKT